MVCLCQELCGEFLANDVPPGRCRLPGSAHREEADPGTDRVRAPLSSCIFPYFLICEQASLQYCNYIVVEKLKLCPKTCLGSSFL